MVTITDKEYIEREALLKHAHIAMTRVSDTEWQKGYWDGVDDMAEYIREQPAADVAEVVRCKDCKYFIDDGYGQPYCKYHTDNVGYCDEACWVDENDFCSYDKRMDGEGE